jgi:hypothetical protein
VGTIPRFQGFSLASLNLNHQALSMSFEESRDQLLAARKAWYAGQGTKQAMTEAASECARLYNAKARAIAKKLGIKPQLTTPDRIMRNIDRAIK